MLATSHALCSHPQLTLSGAGCQGQTATVQVFKLQWFSVVSTRK